MKQLTPNQSAKLARDLKLKPRTKQFADLLLQDPTINQTNAYLNTHKTNNPNTGAVEASKTLRKPNVQIYMDKHINKAKMKIVSLVDSEKDDIALRASQDILDRTQGKATIQTDSNTYTQINISLGNTDTTPEVINP